MDGFIMEIPIKMDDLGVPPFWGNAHMLQTLKHMCRKNQRFLTRLLEESPPVPGNHLHIRWGKGRLTLQMSRV